ncbi:hypothetical protein HDE_05823 [Halotydeus destructor]|nr:hypothetical protein HDE_05823 [Halotydeus destructor]
MTVTLIVSLVVAVSVGRLADCLTNDKDDRRAHMSHYAYGSKYPYAINHQLRLPPPHHYHHQHHDFKPVRGPSFALTTLLPIMTTSTTTTTPAAPTGQSVPMVSVNCNRNSNQANDGQNCNPRFCPLITITAEPDIGDEFAAAYYLDRAKESLNYYQERVMQELDGLRERDRELNEKLSRVSHVVAANDRDLGTCRAALVSLENTVAQQVREVNGCRTSLASSETANKMAASELTSCKAVRDCGRRQDGGR